MKLSRSIIATGATTVLALAGATSAFAHDTWPPQWPPQSPPPTPTPEPTGFAVIAVGLVVVALWAAFRRMKTAKSSM